MNAFLHSEEKTTQKETTVLQFFSLYVRFNLEEQVNYT